MQFNRTVMKLQRSIKNWIPILIALICLNFLPESSFAKDQNDPIYEEKNILISQLKQFDLFWSHLNDSICSDYRDSKYIECRDMIDYNYTEIRSLLVKSMKSLKSLPKLDQIDQSHLSGLMDFKSALNYTNEFLFGWGNKCGYFDSRCWDEPANVSLLRDQFLIQTRSMVLKVYQLTEKLVKLGRLPENDYDSLHMLASDKQLLEDQDQDQDQMVQFSERISGVKILIGRLRQSTQQAKPNVPEEDKVLSLSQITDLNEKTLDRISTAAEAIQQSDFPNYNNFRLFLCRRPSSDQCKFEHLIKFVFEGLRMGKSIKYTIKRLNFPNGVDPITYQQTFHHFTDCIAALYPSPTPQSAELLNRLEEAFEYKANPNKCWDKNETALEARIRFNKDIWSARVIQSFNSLNEGPNLNFNVTSGNKKSEFLKEEIKKQMARANHSISQISIYSNDPKLKRWLSRLMSQLDKSQLAFQSNSIYHPDSIQQIFNSASCLKLANIKLKMALEDSDRSEIFIDPSVVVQYSKDLGESANGLSNIFNYSPSLENCVLD